MTRLDDYVNVSGSSLLPETMQAVVLSGRGEENLNLTNVRVPECGDNQLLGRVDAAVACASDNKLVDQGSNHPLVHGWDVSEYPVTIGHEGTITVVRVGDNLRSKYRVGQRLAIQPAVPTGPIRYRERYKNDARGVVKIGIGYTLPGLFAEYVLVTEETIETDCLIPLANDNIPYFSVALVEPISCAIAAQERMVHFSDRVAPGRRHAEFGPRRGGTTLVIGDGPMGLINADVATAFAPRTIIVSGHHPRRINRIKRALGARAEKLGINLACTLSEDLAEVFLKETGGRGADDIIVAAGSRQAHEEGLAVLARGGVIHFFGGVPTKEKMIAVDSHKVHYDRVSIVGSSGSDSSHIVRALEMISEGLIEPSDYVVKCGGMDAALSLIRAIRRREIDGKGVIYPHARSVLFDVEGWSLENERNFLEENLLDH